MIALLVDVTVVVHFAALIFIGFGGFLAWHWPKAIFVHVFFAAWGVVVNVTPLPCPLTTLENHLRHRQGLGDLPGGFNEYYVFGPIIPDGYGQYVAFVAVAVLVVSYAGAFTRWRSRRSPLVSAAK
ncbi:putative membrane protein [Actinokineospora spheciospongiae]|uniref:Putative membrane protein n=1 Tax=Actinokineospora spheciospongiae TaxID=909613 RepID=W7IYF3_9PSEU|nr:DUF2784 domain-containing protein [Actinokineospora spheciospongiae]EWC61521.1 putative membrane protein [Actinokineospora spheciospongiae]